MVLLAHEFIAIDWEDPQRVCCSCLLSWLTSIVYVAVWIILFLSVFNHFSPVLCMFTQEWIVRQRALHIY